jgi:hypothetical protein
MPETTKTNFSGHGQPHKTVPGIVWDTPPIESDKTCRKVQFLDGDLCAFSDIRNYGTHAIVDGEFRRPGSMETTRISLRVGYDVANWIYRTGVKGRKTFGAAPIREILETKAQANVPALGGNLLCGALIYRNGTAYSVNAFVRMRDASLVPRAARFGKEEGEQLVKATKAKPHVRRPTASICALGVDMCSPIVSPYINFLRRDAAPGLEIVRMCHDLDVSHVCGNPRILNTAVLLEGASVMRDGDKWSFFGDVRRNGRVITMGRPLTYEQVLVMFEGYHVLDRPMRPMPRPHQRCPNRYSDVPF